MVTRPDYPAAMPHASPEGTEPPLDCPLCPRLTALRADLRDKHPDWWNAPVRAFGDADPWLGIIGLAPGRNGANRTGRPFTGDHAGDLLYDTLYRFGLSNGRYARTSDDGLVLRGTTIVNAVRCLPPQNKPTPAEIANCRPFLSCQIAAFENLRVLIALGRIAHETVLRTFGERIAAFPFGHGAEHRLTERIVMIDSYHCSRYNTNTGRLTPEMFAAVFERAVAIHKGA